MYFNFRMCNLKRDRNSILLSKKGAGDAISALIMFIAVIGISVAMVMAIQNYAVETKQSMGVQNDVVNNQLRTAVQITNMVYNATEQNIYIYVKNIGDTKLITADFDIFVDDIYIYNYSTYYASNLSKNMSIMFIQETGVFVKNKVLGSGSHKVKLVSGYGGNGDTDYFNT